MSINLKDKGWQIHDEISIGRAKTNVIVLPEVFIPRASCSITRTGEKYYLQPLSNKNLKINGVPCVESSVDNIQLNDQDVISIALYDFTVVLPSKKRPLQDPIVNPPKRKTQSDVIDIDPDVIELSSDDEKITKTSPTSNSQSNMGNRQKSPTITIGSQDAISAPIVEKAPPGKEEKTCELCLDDLPFDEFQGFECNHEFCRGCIYGYIKSRMDGKNLPIPCPKCQKEVGPNDLQLCMDEVEFHKYQQILTDLLLENNPQQYSCCPTPNCDYAFFYLPGDKTDFLCPTCGKWYCLQCHVNYHSGVTCEKYQEWATENGKADQLFEKFVTGSKFKQCPGCNRWTEKTVGCNHMTCVCKTQFCYVCGQLYPKKCKGDCNLKKAPVRNTIVTQPLQMPSRPDIIQQPLPEPRRDLIQQARDLYSRLGHLQTGVRSIAPVGNPPPVNRPVSTQIGTDRDSFDVRLRRNLEENAQRARIEEQQRRDAELELLQLRQQRVQREELERILHQQFLQQAAARNSFIQFPKKTKKKKK
jgi:pSer/pThr/pTyr-binding forkhead associated (FHA) protein